MQKMTLEASYCSNADWCVCMHACVNECMRVSASTSHHTTKPTPYELKTYVEEKASQRTVH